MSAFPQIIIRGQVVDTAGAPIGGATVTALNAGTKLTVTECSSTGHFSLTLNVPAGTFVTIRATAVGFQDTTVTVATTNDSETVTVVCHSKIIERSGIEVTASRPDVISDFQMGRTEISRGATSGIILNDPLAAVRYPQLAHSWLNLASQLRIDGSLPRYYLNGMSIGADPTHFGVFSVIPAQIVDQLTFSPEGTDASFPVPTVIGLNTTDRFENRHQGSVSLSVVDLTGSYLLSSERSFVSAAVRQSLMNDLAEAVNLGSSRFEIPTPRFSDLVLGLGHKLSHRFTLLYDQYHTDDELSYELAEKTGAQGSVHILQKSTQDHAAATLRFVQGDVAGSIDLGLRNGHRSLDALPTADETAGFHVNFAEKYTNYLTNAGLVFTHGALDLKAGLQYESMSKLELHLDQSDWNTLSPFAHTDNLDYNQLSVDDYYGTYDGSVHGFNSAIYGSAILHLGPMLFENGIRYETFSYLAHKNAVAGRHALRIITGSRSDLRLFYGTFFETPVSSALESYQIPVRIWLSTLDPIQTRLATCSYTYGPVTLELFGKEITGQPVMTPDYSSPLKGWHSYRDMVTGLWIYYPDPSPNFVEVHSAGKSTFIGSSVVYDAPRFISDRLALYISYAYSQAKKTIEGVTIPYDLDAPHRFVLQADYRAGKHLRFGLTQQLHTGYPYSPYRPIVYYSSEHSNQFLQQAYLDDLRRQNSLRFPVNAGLDLHCSWEFSRGEIFLTIVNVTNHANAMISSGGNYIYDAGLIPNIGFRYQF